MSAGESSDRPITVLHLGKYFPPHAGGMETYLRDLMVSSVQSGDKTAALVHQSHFGLTSSQESFSVKNVDIPVTRAATWCRLLYTPISPGFPWLLHRLIRRHRPDVLHLHLPNPSAFWALWLPAARRIPWVVHWQSDVMTPKSHWIIKLAYRLYAPLESALLVKATRIIATSPPYLETSKPLKQVHSKCTVVPLGIDDRFGHKALNLSAGCPPSEVACDAPNAEPLRVLAIGRMAHYKGFDVLLRALAQTEHIELDLVGDGEQSVSLQNLAPSLGIEARVRFHGKLSNDARDQLIAACDCLCLPSTDRTESFGVVILEAMSAAKACVVSDVAGSGMAWLVDNQKTGLIVPSNNLVALAKALCQLRDNRSINAELGQAGRKKFLASFTIDASATALRRIYRELLAAG